MENFYLLKTCRMCAGNNLKNVINLTATPPGNNFLEESELLESEPIYPLDVYFCEDCYHLNLVML